MNKPVTISDAWFDILHQWHKGQREATIDIGHITKEYREIRRDIGGRCDRLSCDVNIVRCSPTTLSIRKV